MLTDFMGSIVARASRPCKTPPNAGGSVFSYTQHGRDARATGKRLRGTRGTCALVPAMLMACLLLVRPSAAFAEQVLFDAAQEADIATAVAKNVKVTSAKTEKGTVLRVMVSQGQAGSAGVELPAPKGRWDLSDCQFITLDVRAIDSNMNINCRVDTPGSDEKAGFLAGSISLAPGNGGTLRIPLTRKPPAKIPRELFFGMNGIPECIGDPSGIDTANVSKLFISISGPQRDCGFEVSGVRAGGVCVPPAEIRDNPEKFFPFIDEFGQYIHKDWPGKTHSVAEMAQRREEEENDLAAHPGPANWDQYGGWKDGPTLKATGFFYPAKHDGRWWLVDPEGKLFLSHGIDCVNIGEVTAIDDRRNWFRDLPSPDGEFKEFYSKSGAIMGHYNQKWETTCFSFSGANMFRKYGPDWRNSFRDMAHRRLRSWGMNTIGNWSEAQVSEQHRTPYVTAVWVEKAKPLMGSKGYWGKFPDVFDPDFTQKIQQGIAKHKAKSFNDPWCIGHFVDNEYSWGDELSLAVAALSSPAEQVAKKVFIDDLKVKYGTIDKLNQAWGTSHESWDALLASTTPPDRTKASEDLLAFYIKTADMYFRTVRDAVKQAAPNNLYLGCRFAMAKGWTNPVAADVSAKYCDIIHIQRLSRSRAG